MTIFLGMIDLNGLEINHDRKSILKHTLEVDINDKCSFELFDRSFYCLSYDNGAHKETGVFRDKDSFTLTVGDPIIVQTNKRSRQTDTLILHKEFINKSITSLSEARGVFSGIHFNSVDQECYIFTDKLGIRPVYFYMKSGLLVFSSILKYFEKFIFLDLKEDYNGMCEVVAFKFPLADRTPYKYIKLLKSSEILSIKKNELTSNTYWDWGSVESSVLDSKPDDLSKLAFNVFDDAVRLRIGDEKNTIAFLSGGLDSRCVTAAVKKYVGKLYTFNFATNKSQDGEFANVYSKNLESKHYEIKMDKLEFPNWSQLIADAWLNDTHLSEAKSPLYPQKIWSGDGGSVGIGFVYLDELMINLLEEGSVCKAVEKFIKVNKIGLPLRFMSRQDGDSLIYNAILDEIKNMDTISNSRRLYMFLMLNDQRRHLHTHFETIGSHKIELMLPFFDSAFLSVILSVPIEQCLGHGFYMEWFDKYPSFVRISPWQTYPGHKKCPLETPLNLSYQWERNKFKSNKDLLEMKLSANDAIKKIIKKPALKKYLNRHFVFIAMLLHKYNIRDYSYVVSLVNTLDRYTLSE